MGRGQIKHVLAKTQRQQRLSQPVDISSTLSCLPQNVQLYFRGFSELRQVASWMSEALECAGEGLSATEECHDLHPFAHRFHRYTPIHRQRNMVYK